ncbi:MAG: FHA domain-containing protein [Planctomycetes bacterium]|nr:FHA domain-containing protein [Planctomycetota bacterium]
MVDVDFYLIFADRRARRLLSSRNYVIGRETGVDIHLQDALISRRHMEMKFEDDKWHAIDLNSRNGVLVNGERIDGTQALNDADMIQISGQVFSFYMVPPGSDLGSITSQAPEISGQATMAPGMSLESMQQDAAAFTGILSEGGLLELLQFFSMTKKTGRLDLTDKGETAVWILDGVPQDAAANGIGGFEGLLAAARDPGSKFSFQQDLMAPNGPQIQGTSDGIFMEVARQLDESGR